MSQTFHAAIKMSIKHETVLGCPLNILSAHSRAEALELINAFDGDISLIFLDVIMETENAGFELLADIRESDALIQPQVAMVTGQAGLTSELDATRAHEINAYLPKSDLTPNRLITILNTLIRSFVTIQKLEETTQQLRDAQG